MGPAKIVAAGLDWSTDDLDGWPEQLNELKWPRGGDRFGCLLLLISDAQADLLEATVAAQVSSWTQGDPRPYVVLSALLAPKEGAYPAESYAPAGIDPVTVETALQKWKLYPLPHVRLPEASNSDTFKGLWLLPLVDIRYFERITNVYTVESGSGGAGPEGIGFPHIDQDYTQSPDWMPPLLGYATDVASPGNYVAISGNGTHYGISNDSPRGRAMDIQASMEGWRIVCRDVVSNYNSQSSPHTSFTGVLSDYPDATTATESYHLDAIRLAQVEGNLIAGGLTDNTQQLSLQAQKLQFLFRVISAQVYYSIILRKNTTDVIGVANLSEDSDGLTASEQNITPKLTLGVEANTRTPVSTARSLLVAAAKQRALLYYLWRRKQAFFKFPGIAPVMPNGHCSMIRWSFSSTDLSTTYVAVEGVDEEDYEDAGLEGSTAGDFPIRYVQVVGTYDASVRRWHARVYRQEGLPADWIGEEVGWIIGANYENLQTGRRYLARAGNRYQGLITWAAFCCDGGGSGSGDPPPPEEPIQTACCVDPIPVELEAIWTVISGSAPALDGTSFPVTYDAGSSTEFVQIWAGEKIYTVPARCRCGTIDVFMECSGGVWFPGLSYTGGSPIEPPPCFDCFDFSGATHGSVTCSPLTVVWSNILFNDGVTTATLSLTVTEPTP